MTFEELLDQAKAQEPEAVLTLFERYRPLLLSRSYDEYGRFNEDLWQDQCHRFLIVIQMGCSSKGAARFAVLIYAPAICPSSAAVLAANCGVNGWRISYWR